MNKPETQSGGSLKPVGSEDGRTTWPKWRSEALRLQRQLDALKDEPASHEQTVLYLLSVADTMLKAADLLIKMRQDSQPPNVAGEPQPRKPGT